MAQQLSKAPGCSVAVFAHDEASQITACLTSLQNAGLDPYDTKFVLNNGSTDGTEAVVSEMAKDDERIKEHSVIVPVTMVGDDALLLLQVQATQMQVLKSRVAPRKVALQSRSTLQTGAVV
jgi:glycosyltransferase involved in cell wall biosynthesis